MANPAFIVEGQMEQKIIGRLCPGQPVQRIMCNGDQVPITRLCDFVETLIRRLNNKYYPIFVIFDREKREDDCKTLSIQMLDELNSRGLNDQDIRIFLADRESEDWILKDIDAICAHYNIAKPRQAPQGKGGLRSLVSSVTPYHETTTGVELFFLVSKDEIAKKCPYFRSLRESVRSIGCFI